MDPEKPVSKYSQWFLAEVDGIKGFQNVAERGFLASEIWWNALMEIMDRKGCENFAISRYKGWVQIMNRTDPFSSVAKSMSSQEYSLLHHYVHVVVPHTIGRCLVFKQVPGHRGHVLQDWVGLAITDRDLLCSGILLRACRDILQRNPHDPALTHMALQYKQIGLVSLRRAVGDISPTVSALTIAKAVALALDEVDFGDAHVARQHLKVPPPISIMSSPISDIPIGSWILVTGATGFVASHVIKQLLERGYKVRGTTRDQAKAQWVIDDHFKSYTDSGSFELATVPDISVDGAFDEAAKDVSAIAHIASVLDFDPNPNNVIPQTVAGVTSLLETASKENSVKKFVYTSSMVAAVMPTPEDETRVERHTWNNFATEAAWMPPPYEPSRNLFVYAASKTAAEQELWKFVEEKKPHFSTNVISPAVILGEPLHKRHVESFGNWIYSLFMEKREMLDPCQSAWFVDVKDVARLHVAGILDPELKSTRLQAWGHVAHWNDVLTILRELRPQRRFLADYPETFHIKTSTDQSESVAILNKWGGQNGWKSLMQTISEGIDNPYWQVE
ncbi:hypothetical protein F66182_10241 [Fusarium sp. NRRL 66182]|nr:hypothetical protein F66182_10241 [Fusarium sp. NRRL 66182]